MNGYIDDGMVCIWCVVQSMCIHACAFVVCVMCPNIDTHERVGPHGVKGWGHIETEVQEWGEATWGEGVWPHGGEGVWPQG